MKIKLSILICSVPSRIQLLSRLMSVLQPQLDKNNDVECIVLTDNKKMSIGEKRNELIRLAHGDYIAFVDDDDLVSEDYIDELVVAGIQTQVDIICFQSMYFIDGKQDRIMKFSKNFKNSTTKECFFRAANHLMCIRRDLALQVVYKNISYYEDSDWCTRVNPLLKTEHIIEKVLYKYFYSNTESLSILDNSINWRSIPTVINLCSYDTPLFHALYLEVSKFTHDIIVVTHERLLTGELENEKELDKLRIQYKNINWQKLPWVDGKDNVFRQKSAEWLGATQAKKRFVLFINSDEIPYGDLMRKFLETSNFIKTTFHTFSCYWYLYKPEYQASTLRSCGSLLCMKDVTKEMFFTDEFYKKFNLTHSLNVKLNGSVLFNKYDLVGKADTLMYKCSLLSNEPYLEYIKKVANENKCVRALNTFKI